MQPLPSPFVVTSEAELGNLARAWFKTPELHHALRVGGAPAELLALGPAGVSEIADWAAANWDFRQGRERWESKPTTFSPHLVDALQAAAFATGLIETPAPTLPSYSLTVVLGGTTTGNTLRARLTCDLAARGIALGTVVGLSARRELSKQELETTDGSVNDEASHLHQALTGAFGVDLEVVTAPGIAHRRPTTPEAVAYLCETLPAPARTQVLLVTSAIYAPYQFFSASPVLLRAGTSHAELVGTTTRVRDAAGMTGRVAQELNAALQAVSGAVNDQAG